MQLDQNPNKDWVWHAYSPVRMPDGGLIFVQGAPVHLARPLLSSQSTPSGRPVFSRLMLPTNTPTEPKSKPYVSNESGTKRRKLQLVADSVGQSQQTHQPVLKIIGPNAVHNTAQSTITPPASDDHEFVCQVLCELSNQQPMTRFQSKTDSVVTEDVFESAYAGEHSSDSGSSATRSESSPVSSPSRQPLLQQRSEERKNKGDEDDDYDDKKEPKRRQKARYRVKRKAHVLQTIKPDPASPIVPLQPNVLSAPVSQKIVSTKGHPSTSPVTSQQASTTLLLLPRQKNSATTPTAAPKRNQKLTIHVSQPVQEVFSEKNPEPKKYKLLATNQAGRKMADLPTTDSICSSNIATGRTRFTVPIS